jgi:hypothetical protein
MNEKIYDALDTGGERILLHWTTYEPGVVPGNPKWEIPGKLNKPLVFIVPGNMAKTGKSQKRIYQMSPPLGKRRL